MSRVAILTDCTCDLTKDLIEKNDIKVLPLYITLNGVTYQDGVDITQAEMYKLIDKVGQLPKTSNIPPIEFEKEFDELLKEYDQIVYMGISSALSSTYNSAIIASTSFPEGKIFVCDSKNLSSGIGLLLLKAVKFRDQGFEGKEIKEKVEELVPYVRTQFSINTLKYMHMGGRCSGVSRLFGTMLKLKPIIRVIDGKLIVGKKPVGYNRALEALLGYAENDFDKMDLDNVFITHSMADNDAVYLRSELAKKIPNEIIHETFASGVISTHCGPRTIGILYLVKPE